jgi:hypothetical protein
VFRSNPSGFGWVLTGSRRTAWQWQPTLTAHDPNPPITLEDGAPPVLDQQVTSICFPAIFLDTQEVYFDGDGFVLAPLGADLLVTPPGGGIGPTPTPDQPPYTTPLRYIRVRAIDWNTRVGPFSAILNTRTGLATSAHIGFQAVTSLVRAEYVPPVLAPDVWSIVAGTDLVQVGHTDIDTLGGTVLVDVEVEVDWQSNDTTAAIRVALMVDGNESVIDLQAYREFTGGDTIDDSPFIPFPCDMGALAIPKCRSVISGLGLPAQLPPGRHTFYVEVESLTPGFIDIDVLRVRVALLELRR